MYKTRYYEGVVLILLSTLVREPSSGSRAKRELVFCVCDIFGNSSINKMPGRPIWQCAGKREPEKELEAQAWIEAVIGERFRSDLPFELALRDGIILCKLMNRLQPGIITKVNIGGGDYKFMDNINQFQKACVKYGVPDVDLFQTTDLWDQKNIALVTSTIFAVGRTAYKHPEWRGPSLGPKPAEENRREFSEDVLRAGEGVIGLQAGTNNFATQSGQSFGASRKIILGK